MVKCVRISIVCLENTKEGIEKGGPKHFGFTFDVEAERKDKILDFIVTKLSKMKLPLKSICIDDEIEVSELQVWDENRISASFEKHEEELIKEVLKQKNNKSKRR